MNNAVSLNKQTFTINIIIIIVWHAVTLVLFSLAENIPQAWHTQGIVLIIVVSALSGIIPFFRERKGLSALIFFKFFFIFLLCYPLGHNLYLRMLFQTPLFFEMIFYLQNPWGTVVAAASLPGFLFIPRTVSAWGIVLPSTSRWEIGFSVLFQGLLIFVLARSRYQRGVLRKKEEQIELLNGALEKVIDTNMDYQTYASSVKESTLDEERKRVSRELHDIIGYTLTNQLMIIQAIRSFNNDDWSRFDALLEKAEGNLREGLADARASLRQLRAEKVHGSHGLKLFVNLVDNFSEVTGIDVKLELASITEGLDIQEEKVLYRIMQEGMTNAFRHGEADQIRIILSEDESGYECIMRDNGRGAAKVEEGIGLAGIKERVESLGGALFAGPSQDGFTLKCRIPKGERSD